MLTIMRPLKRYWFRFERLPQPNAINLGCGLSAYDYEDAIRLLRELVFGDNGPPPIEQFIEDVDIATLEPDHVRPNLGSVDVRGIWFPQGYELPRR
jgi:hypothetical protein